MIARIVSFALSQRFIVLMAALMLMVWGAYSFSKLPIDAYPDLSPPHVEIITQWPGHASEEVERLISIPLEVEMNGIPKIESLRSISLYGLSALEMNFQYDIDPYFVREQAFERMAERDSAQWRDPRRFSVVQPQRPDLSLRTGEPGSHAAAAQDHRSLGSRAQVPLHSWRRRRFRTGRHNHAVPGAAESLPSVLAR